MKDGFDSATDAIVSFWRDKAGPETTYVVPIDLAVWLEKLVAAESDRHTVEQQCRGLRRTSETGEETHGVTLEAGGGTGIGAGPAVVGVPS